MPHGVKVVRALAAGGIFAQKLLIGSGLELLLRKDPPAKDPIRLLQLVQL